MTEKLGMSTKGKLKKKQQQQNKKQKNKLQCHAVNENLTFL